MEMPQPDPETETMLLSAMKSDSPINDGGPAFPSEQGHTPDLEWNQTFERGMTLRDWFAGQALSGILADPNTHVGFTDETTGSGWSNDPRKFITEVSESAYEHADAMIAARNQPNK